MKQRCEERVNFCLQSLKTAVENFRQVGGTLDITDTHVQLVNALKESERQIFELKDQLEYDRLLRERIQAELDRKQREINQLKAQLQQFKGTITMKTKFIPKHDPARFKPTERRKKSPAKKKRKQNSGLFVKVRKQSTPDKESLDEPITLVGSR